MKKVLVLTAVLFLMASVSQAAILETWLQFVTAGSQPDDNNLSLTTALWNVKVNGTKTPCFVTLPGTAPTSANVGSLYTVEIWCKIVPDPSIPSETTALVGQYSLDQDSFSICTVGTHYVTEPNISGDDPFGQNTGSWTPNTVDSTLICTDSTNNTPAQRIDANNLINPYDIPDGDMDAIELSIGIPTTKRGNTDGGYQTCLVAAENWVLEQWQRAPLHLEVASSSNCWDNQGNQVQFSQIQTGTLDANGNFVSGTDLYVGPTPEPATLALLGFGAVATLLRRRNNKK